MSGASGSLRWGIRWETVERIDGNPLYGALMPETYLSLRAARRAEQRLEMLRPARPSPFRAGESKPVRYIIFARREDDVHGL